MKQVSFNWPVEAFENTSLLKSNQFSFVDVKVAAASVYAYVDFAWHGHHIFPFKVLKILS